MSFLVPVGPGGLGQNWLSLLPKKRSIFVSYHHNRDQYYYNEFSRLFSDTYDVIRDNSVDRIIDSDDPEYVMRRIRENYITGSSCTIVLCGPETRWRKYVDWEIKATLDKNHGLIGINLPHNPKYFLGRVHKPDRLQDNLDSYYALWMDWGQLNAHSLKSYIELAIDSPKILINNGRELRRINGGDFANPLERLLFA